MKPYRLIRARLMPLLLSLAGAILAQTPDQTQPPAEKPKTAALAAPGQISLQNSPVLTVGPNTAASAPLILVNHTGGALRVRLAVARIENPVTHALTNPKKVTFDGLDDKAAGAGIEIPPEGKTVTLAIESEQWQPGESEARLTEGASPLAVVKVANLRPPLSDISVPNETYFVQPGQTNLLTLENKGKLVFPLQWRLVIDGQPSGVQTVLLGPGETARSALKDAPAAWRSTGLKDDDKEGMLELNLSGSSDAPLRFLPIKVHVTRSFGSQLCRSAGIFVLLLLGAILSYLVNMAVPNLRKVALMKGEVTEVGRRVSGVSDRIDSRLRVLIAVELQRLRTRASGSITALSPNFADSYSADLDALGSLKSRLDHVEMLDALRSRYYVLRLGNFPPEAIFDMDEKLQAAADLLRQIRPTQGDLENARTVLLEASVQIKSLGSSADMSDRVVQEAKRLKQGFIQFRPAAEEFLQSIPALVDFPVS
jgi:hypothetical protein